MRGGFFIVALSGIATFTTGCSSWYIAPSSAQIARNDKSTLAVMKEKATSANDASTVSAIDRELAARAKVADEQTSREKAKEREHQEFRTKLEADRRQFERDFNAQREAKSKWIDSVMREMGLLKKGQLLSDVISRAGEPTGRTDTSGGSTVVEYTVRPNGTSGDGELWTLYFLDNSLFEWSRTLLPGHRHSWNDIRMKLETHIEQDEDGKFVASCPSLPGCWSQGDTHDEAARNLEEAIAGYLESVRKHGDPLPAGIE